MIATDQKGIPAAANETMPALSAVLARQLEAIEQERLARETAHRHIAPIAERAPRPYDAD